MSEHMTTDEIERIVKLIESTADADVKKILKDYLASALLPMVVKSSDPPGSIKFL